MASMLSPVDLMPSGIEHGNVTLVIITSVFTFLATVAVILRFISRRISVSVKWDDWFSLIALILAYGCLVVTVLDATVAHGGYNIEYYSAATLEKFLKPRTYCTPPVSPSRRQQSFSSIIESSTSKKSFRIASWIVGFFIAAYFIAGECLLIFAYTPIEAQWKPWLPSSANFNIVATCICIADAMHVVCVVTQVDINNPTATEGTTGIWENVEVNLSVIVTCLPTFPSLISHWRNGPRSGSGSYDNEYKKSLNNGDFPRMGNSTTFSCGSEREQNSMDKAYYGSSYNMNHMGPVHVQTDVRVRWDGESHHSMGSMV
ncbi:hypothetical protein N7493_011652 [Penicillium malachiteum]|uniref:Rhodopsin domain-containing protein n=1 Tax=Penicillium malachiteum TaxID=1324776 RepID=A0AAD6HA77_9EURO|nr:hypothetical protein N7493_011652 [Penicillium malachiteum]